VLAGGLVPYGLPEALTMALAIGSYKENRWYGE
jgi:hypothetical protein